MNEAMQQFFTRERANEGIKFPLSFPDGRESPHWLTIRGVDSDQFKTAEAASRRRIFALTAEKAADKSQVDKLEQEEKLETIASLVAAWSFDEPCTLEAIKTFLREAPQIADAVNRLATRRTLFFGSSSNVSTPSPAPTSS